MELDIYSLLSEEYIQKIPRATFEKGDIVFPAEELEVVSIYYILEGEVAVSAYSFKGRQFLIDELGPGDFAGKFSQLRKCNFFCEGIAVKKSVMLDITHYASALFEDQKFSLYFYKKTTDRLYRMYKIAMARSLFAYDELLAYYLISMADKNNHIVFGYKYIYMKLNISRRNFFYILEKLIDQGVLSRKGNNLFIENMEYLRNAASHVFIFMGETY